MNAIRVTGATGTVFQLLRNWSLVFVLRDSLLLSLGNWCLYLYSLALTSSISVQSAVAIEYRDVYCVCYSVLYSKRKNKIKYRTDKWNKISWKGSMTNCWNFIYFGFIFLNFEYFLMSWTFIPPHTQPQPPWIKLKGYFSKHCLCELMFWLGITLPVPVKYILPSTCSNTHAEHCWELLC